MKLNIILAIGIIATIVNIVNPILATCSFFKSLVCLITLPNMNITIPRVTATKIAVTPCINVIGEILLNNIDAKTIPPATAAINTVNTAPLPNIAIMAPFHVN